MNGKFPLQKGRDPMSPKNLLKRFAYLSFCLVCTSLLLSLTSPGQAVSAWAGSVVGRFFGKEDTASPSQPEPIKWVDFNVTCQAMNQAFRYDVDTCQEEIHLNWVDLLAYLGALYGGDFSLYKSSDMEKAAQALKTMRQPWSS